MALGNLNAAAPVFQKLTAAVQNALNAAPQAAQATAAPTAKAGDAQNALATQTATSIGLPTAAKPQAAPADPAAQPDGANGANGAKGANGIGAFLKAFADPKQGPMALFLGLLVAMMGGLGKGGDQAAQAGQGADPTAAPTSTPDMGATSTPGAQPTGGAGPDSAPTSTPSSTPGSAPTSEPTGGAGADSAPNGNLAYVVGNAVTGGGVSLREYLTNPMYGASLAANPQAKQAFDKLLATNSPALDQVIPDHQSAVVSGDGKFLGFKATSEIEDNASLGMQNHVRAEQGMEDMGDGGMRHSWDSASVGGQVTGNDGKNYSVAATHLVSPIALDLDGDGKIATTGVSTSRDRKALAGDQLGKTVSFDIDGDGKKDQVEWLHGAGDGMLVDDHDGGATRAENGDGQIDGKRLFGDEGGKYGNGYEKLARYDANHDGKLTGKELSGLKVWQDRGSDAKVGKGELKSLAELGVTELDVTMHKEKNARGEDLMRAGFTQNGKKKMTEDVWFGEKK